MKTVNWKKLFCAVLAAGWCLLFLRCETTEKSMVRALCLAPAEQGVSVQLLYQAPDAAADASEASVALQLAGAQAASLERALAAAQAQLPHTADYRLCDYLLLAADTPQPLLQEYEAMVLRTECGRVAARVVCADFTAEELEQACDENEAVLDELMGCIKQNAAMLPRLYQYGEGLLLPQVQLQAEGGIELAEDAVFWKEGESSALSRQQAEMARLLSGLGSAWTFWLDDQPVTLRRCSVSVTLNRGEAFVRLDCQRGYHTPQPSTAQCRQLEQLCVETVQAFWQKGVDLAHLQQHGALRYGSGQNLITTKNACPQVQADVEFLPM